MTHLRDSMTHLRDIISHSRAIALPRRHCCGYGTTATGQFGGRSAIVCDRSTIGRLEQRNPRVNLTGQGYFAIWLAANHSKAAVFRIKLRWRSHSTSPHSRQTVFCRSSRAGGGQQLRAGVRSCGRAQADVDFRRAAAGGRRSISPCPGGWPNSRKYERIRPFCKRIGHARAVISGALSFSRHHSGVQTGACNASHPR
jgi:hypothetical protein